MIHPEWLVTPHRCRSPRASTQLASRPAARQLRRGTGETQIAPDTWGRATPLRDRALSPSATKPPPGSLSLAGDDPCRGVRQSLFKTFHTFAQPSARKVAAASVEAGKLRQLGRTKVRLDPGRSRHSARTEMSYSDREEGGKSVTIKELMKIQRRRWARARGGRRP